MQQIKIGNNIKHQQQYIKKSSNQRIKLFNIQ